MIDAYNCNKLERWLNSIERHALLLILLVMFVTLAGCAQQGERSESVAASALVKSHEQLGAQIESIRQGLVVQRWQQLQASEREELLAQIVILGTDQRYYTLMRGWLVQELAGVRSQLMVGRGGDDLASERVMLLLEREAFLQSAIRRIDLE